MKMMAKPLLPEVVDEGVSSKLVEDVGDAPPAEELVGACRHGSPKMFGEGDAGVDIEGGNEAPHAKVILEKAMPM
jgi:hypothetical protein